jgi:2-polyprenyl-6-methoxyphenol hydroxylase-like FAD-dependent oxidoreductase
MSLEDGIALETLFKGITSKSDVEAQVQLFDKLRRPRVSAVQTMSNKMMGPPDRMISEVKRYYDGPIAGRQAKTFSKEYNDFFFRYDIEEEARNMLNA